MITETTRREKKARKDYNCAECRQTIEKGTVYIGSSEFIEGKYYAIKRHEDCLAAAELLEPEVSNHGTFGRYRLAVMIEKNPDIVPRLEDLLVDYPLVLERLK